MNSKDIVRQARAHILRRLLIKLGLLTAVLGALGAWLLYPQAEIWRHIASGTAHATQWVQRATITALGGTTPSAATTSAADRIVAVNGFSPAEVRCLAHAIYFEAEREKREAQIGVAQVALNRAAAAKAPKAICRIIHTGLNTPNGCLFEQSCRFIGSAPRPGKDFDRAVETAMEVAAGTARVAALAQASHFRNTRKAAPTWTRTVSRIGAYGNLEFYSTEPVDNSPPAAAATAATPAPARAEPERPTRATGSPRKSTPSGPSSAFSADNGEAARRVLGVD